MFVRCGRCRSELEVAGPGEFACPACGTRNVVRGGAAAEPAGLTIPGGRSAGNAPAPGPAPDILWATCPACSYRFAIGAVSNVPCPMCATELSVSDGEVRPVADR